MLYALLSENHGWIHGYLEDVTIEYGKEIKVFDKEFKEIDSLAKKLSILSGEKIYLKNVELHYGSIYTPEIRFKDISRGDKFYDYEWLYSKISDTQAVCIVPDSGTVGLYSGNIYTFQPNDVVKRYE